MALDTSHLFYGKINGKNISYDKLDYNLRGLPNRLEFVKKLLEENDEFLQVYFDKYFESNPTKWDHISHDNNICQKLEQIATYLLTEIDEKKSTLEYRYYNNERNFQNALNKEYSLDKIIEDLSQAVSNTTDGDVIHFLMRGNGSQRVVKDVKVEPKDLKRQDEVGEILRQYDSLKQNLIKIRNQINDGTYETKNNYKPNTTKLRMMIRAIDIDMLDTKLKFDRPIQLKECLAGSTKSCWDEVDFLNPIHVECFLKLTCSDTNFDDDLSLLLNEFNDLLATAKKQLTDKENEVLDLFRWGIKRVDKINEMLKMGFDLGSIKELYTVTPEEVEGITKKAVNLIIQCYENKMQAYLDRCKEKGRLFEVVPSKVCKCCGKRKTLGSFPKHETARDGHRNICNSCRKR